MKTPKILGVAFALAQNLKRIAAWSLPYEMRSEVSSTVGYATVFLLLLIYSYFFIQFDLIQV